MSSKPGPCDSCGSSDARATYPDGHSYCFSCGDYDPGETATSRTPRRKVNNIRKLNPENFKELGDRRISAATARKYMVESTATTHTYPYWDRDGAHHVADKVRELPKQFKTVGDWPRAGLFGMQLFPKGSAKAITLVEGECDAMAAFEMMGSRYPVVSVQSSSVAERNVADNFEYLNSFERIVVCFDRDEGKVNPRTGSVHYPGQEAAAAVAGMFEPGKVHVLTLSEHKDANEYLIAGMGQRFNKEWWGAPPYTPSGLKLGRDMWDEIKEVRAYETVSYPWASANHTTYGMRLSEIVLLDADTGVGKTSVIKEIEAHLLKEGKSVGLLHLEEPNADTALGLMSITADKPLHLPDVRSGVSSDELRRYYDESGVNSDRVVIWDHFGSNSVQEVLNKIRHMHNLGCKYIIVDHLSIIVSDQSGDERKQLDEISTKLKTLCMELNIAVLAVIHINRKGEVRGSAGPAQVANIHLHLHREKEDPDQWRRNVTKITCKKNRFCGRTGPMSYLFYDEATGRLSELTDEEIRVYENGGVAVDDGW